MISYESNSYTFLEGTCDVGHIVDKVKAEFPFAKFPSLDNLWYFNTYWTQDSKAFWESLQPTSDKKEGWWQQAQPKIWEELTKWRNHRNHHFVEPDEPYEQRVAKFKEWLKNRPEKNILVFGHHDFFQSLTGYYVENGSERVFVGKSLKNCERCEWNL
jgi:broad specificity phosphatase PhoE